jgi:putative nucleotidyltransferase with HDIG domain
VLPSIYSRITAELAKGDPSPKDIGNIVAQDAGLSANILKLINSAYFGLARHIATPQQAVISLGINVINSLILSLHVFQSFPHRNGQSFSLQLLWEHCMRTAAIARSLAQTEGLPREQADHAYVAALLHDVGKLLLDSQCPEDSARVHEEVRQKNRRVAEVEAEILSLTHAQVGGYLLGLWGLPGPVVHAVARHHSEAPEPGPLGVAQVVYFANLLDHDLVVFNAHYARQGPEPAWLEVIGGEERYLAWKDAVASMELSPSDA